MSRERCLFWAVFVLVLVSLGMVGCAVTKDSSGKGHWISLFNGKDLTGWKVKITGHELNDNFGNTFRVEDGVPKVSYDQYEKFDGKFGHIFYEKPFSHYRFRVEYRFVRDQVPGGPDVTLNYTYTARSQDDSVGSAFGDITGNPFNDHSIGISAAIPLGNRAAEARLQRSRLEKIQDMSTRDRYRQIIRQDVYEAVSELRRNWRRILAAEQGVIAAYRDYKVEQSQFQLGVRTSTEVLFSATRLADAQLSRIRAFADYEIAQINLARATGTLLGHGQILIASVDIDTRNP